MIGVDTNVLVRYIVCDDAKQSKIASKIFEKELDKDNSFFISAIVLCELIWVLETAYEYPKSVIVAVLEKILATKQFYIDDFDIVWQSFQDYREINMDFSDSYIGHLHQLKGCQHTVTFDKKASRSPLFHYLK